MSELLASLKGSADLFRTMEQDQALIRSLDQITEAFMDTLRGGHRVFFAGNGGSAADSQHLAGELVSRFRYDRPALAGLALSVDTSALTAIGNDYGFEHVFSRQLEGLAAAGDLFVGISTSGNSGNILRALDAAKKIGMRTVGFTGNRGGKMDVHCDLLLAIPHDETPRIQEGHIACGHAICEAVEARLFPKTN